MTKTKLVIILVLSVTLIWFVDFYDEFTAGYMPPRPIRSLIAESTRVHAGMTFLFRYHRVPGEGAIAFVWCKSEHTEKLQLDPQLIRSLETPAKFTEKGWFLMGRVSDINPTSLTTSKTEELTSWLFAPLDDSSVLINDRVTWITLDRCQSSHTVRKHDPVNDKQFEFNYNYYQLDKPPYISSFGVVNGQYVFFKNEALRCL